MRGKVAKKLRRMAEMRTIEKPDTRYVGHVMTAGKMGQRYIVGAKVDPTCTSGLYLQFKKLFRKEGLPK